VCLVLVIHHAKGMCRIKLSFVASLVSPYFFKLCYFRLNVTEHKMSLLFSLQLLSKIFLVLGIIQRDNLTNVINVFM
jgi:hypothetical protein